MNNLERHWWMLVVRGLAGLGLALVLLMVYVPGPPSMAMLATAFGAYAIVDGAAALGFVFRVREAKVSTYVVRGLLGLAVGALALARPGMPDVALTLLMGAWALASGGLELVFGSRVWTAVSRPIGFMLAGTVSIGFGLTLLTFPDASAMGLLALFATFGLADGVAAAAIGFGLHPAPARA
jgi:uncharacterized membrane protein HdeD (DUF308 family)